MWGYAAIARNKVTLRWRGSDFFPADATLGGSAPGRHDLIRLLACQLGHVVELGGERADARRRRANLDNEIADLGVRHHRLDHIPPRPTFARVEAEDLAATPGEDGVDLGRRVGRADDLDGVDRLEQHRIALRQRLDDPDPAGGAE